MIPWCEPGLRRQVWGHTAPPGQGMGRVFTAGMQAAAGQLPQFYEGPPVGAPCGWLRRKEAKRLLLSLQIPSI